MRSFYLLVWVWPVRRSLSFLVTVWQQRDEQTVTNRRDSVCLIHVRAAVRPLGCDTIQKPAVQVFLTTVISHNIWLHWNNNTKKHVFCKLLNVNKQVYFYPNSTCWMCVSIQSISGAATTGTLTVNSPKTASATWRDSGVTVPTVTMWKFTAGVQLRFHDSVSQNTSNTKVAKIQSRFAGVSITWCEAQNLWCWSNLVLGDANWRRF